MGMTGVVKFYDDSRGYGFIIPDGCSANERDRHVFFHESDLDGTNRVERGQEVEYSLLPNYPTPRALVVKLLGKTAYIPIKKGAYGTD